MNKKKLVKVVKNFITDNEIDELNQWTLSHYNEPYFMDPGMNNDESQTRFTTRHSNFRCKEYQDYMVQYPKEVFHIQNRLFKYLNLFKDNIIPFPSFTNGVVTTIAFPPGSCCKHTDPIYFENTYTLHCNFVTQNPESGGITILEGKKYSFEYKDMIMYVSSHVEHEVTECIGDIPRILWVYGFFASLNEINTIFNVNSITYS